MARAGNLSVEAQARYAYLEAQIRQDLTPGATIVELGAAPGDQIARLADLGFQTTALDIDESSDEWGSGEVGRMRELFTERGVAFIPWNLEATPYPLEANSADAVIMTEVFEHLRDYPARSLVEIERILRPGGRLYFTTPNQAYLVNRLRLLAGRNVATPLNDWIGGLVFARHAREYTFAEVAQLMVHARLEPIMVGSRHFNISTGRTSPAARIGKRFLDALATVRPTLGPLIIVVAQKPGTAEA